MQFYSKGNLGHLIMVHYKANVEASMQGCINGCGGSLITVHYNG
jgi:hypothetical protein